MENQKRDYHLPAGYSLFQTVLRSFKFLRNPIGFISDSMARFSGTYSALLPQKRLLILTQDSDFINYVLKDNHTNYHKSELSAGRAAVFLGTGLLFSNGEKWLKQRRLIQPGFHQKKIQELNQIVIDTVDHFLSSFPEGKMVDVYPVLNQLAFDIVINTLFDVDISIETRATLNQIFTNIQYFLIEEMNKPLQRFLYPITGKEKKALRESRKIRRIIQDIILKRIESSVLCNDLLDMLINARYEDTGESMTNEQLIDEILVLIFAGHETTANSLSWLLQLLADDKRVTKKLRDRIAAKGIEEIVKDEYFAAVINEGMRLYSPAWMTERVALKDDTFGTYSYPKGTIIIPFFFGLHRHTSHWKDADSFVPERFINDDGSIKKSKNYFPFGAGPRMCIGNNFAMVEMSVFLYAFLKKYSITPTDRVPSMRPLITLRPDNIFLNIESRQLETPIDKI